MDALNAGFRSFRFAESSTPLRGDDEQGGTHVLMPMRLEEPVPDPENADTAAQEETPAVPEPTNTTTETEPAPATPAATTKEPTMPNEPKTEPTALERLQECYEQARSKLREAAASLADVAGLIKEVTRDDKQRRAEVENVRAGLAKLQSIKV